MHSRRRRIAGCAVACLASVGLAATMGAVQALETEMRSERGQGPSVFGQVSISPWRTRLPDDVTERLAAIGTPAPTATPDAGSAAAPAPAETIPVAHTPASGSSLGVDADLSTHRSTGSIGADGLTDQGIPATPTGKVIYLTIDDGPNHKYTPAMLQILAKYNAKATWFIVGEEAAQTPDMVDKIRQAGHAVGNHTWSHPWLSSLTLAQVRSQLTRVTDSFGPMTCMRPPGGMVNDAVRSVASSLNMRMVMWTVDPFDWKKTSTATIAKTLVSGAQPGSIMLVHDGGGDRSRTVAALPGVLAQLTKQGYRFESIPGCR